METNKKYVTLTGHEALINAIAFSPDGETLASGSEDGIVRVWRMADLEDMYPPLQFTTQVNDVAFSPGGRSLMARCCAVSRVRLTQLQVLLLPLVATFWHWEHLMTLSSLCKLATGNASRP